MDLVEVADKERPPVCKIMDAASSAPSQEEPPEDAPAEAEGNRAPEDGRCESRPRSAGQEVRAQRQGAGERCYGRMRHTRKEAGHGWSRRLTIRKLESQHGWKEADVALARRRAGPNRRRRRPRNQPPRSRPRRRAPTGRPLRPLRPHPRLRRLRSRPHDVPGGLPDTAAAPYNQRLPHGMPRNPVARSGSNRLHSGQFRDQLPDPLCDGGTCKPARGQGSEVRDQQSEDPSWFSDC